MAMNEFLSMGGYGGFIWAAYGLSFAGLVGLVFVSLRQYRQVRERLARFEELPPSEDVSA